MILDVFNKNFTRITNIAFYSYATYIRQLNSCGSFEIHIALGSVAKDILNGGAFILFETNVLGIITFLNPTTDENSGEKNLVIKGFLSNYLLSQRCIPKTMTLKGTRTAVVRSIIDTHCINPTDSKRQLPIILSTDSAYIPDSQNIDTQITGGSVEDAIEKLLDVEEMGYDLSPILGLSSISGFEFRLLKGENRTDGNSAGNNTVVFSKDLRNILKSDYIRNANDYKNMSYVAGEDTSVNRVVVEAGDVSASGLNRFELYVDARDIQSVNENQQQISDSDYQNLLSQRGLEKLSEVTIENSYSASVYELNSQYKFETDYNLGDLVTIYDSDIDMRLDARVTAVRFTSIGEKNLVDVTFGYYRISNTKKLRREGVI